MHACVGMQLALLAGVLGMLKRHLREARSQACRAFSIDLHMIDFRDYVRNITVLHQNPTNYKDQYTTKPAVR